MKRGPYQGVKMMDWYVPSFIALVIASIGTISLPVHLSSYRERGVLRRFRASGVSEAALLGSQLLVSLGIGAGGRAHHHRPRASSSYGARSAVSPAEVALAYVVSMFCFVAIGVLLASLAPTARAAQSVGLLLWFVMLFVSGTSAPHSLLPSWMVSVGKALPLYHCGARAGRPVDRPRHELDAARHRGRDRSGRDRRESAGVPLGVSRSRVPTGVTARRAPRRDAS